MLTSKEHVNQYQTVQEIEIECKMLQGSRESAKKLNGGQVKRK